MRAARGAADAPGNPAERSPRAGGDAALAVVIPCLNEARCLGDLLHDLERQQGIRLEVVVVDGGSIDGTARAAEEFSGEAPLRIRVLRAARGRARQLNAGARASSAPEILFLHADCRLADPDLLGRAERHLALERDRRRCDRLAGHFGLQFLRTDPRASLAYYYYEAKAGLNRPGCVNGDQGFWLTRRYFEELGGFDDSATLLEDGEFAARVFATGVWVKLPGTISTSARRFEVEGLLERQTLNALLRAFHSLAVPSFFRLAATLYRVQHEAERLHLRPFLRVAHRAMWDGGIREGLRLWLRAGRYVRSQAWQIAFWLDCRRNFRRGLPPGCGPAPRLEGWERWGGADRLRRFADAAAAAVTAGWLYGSLAWTGARGVFSSLRHRNSR